MMQVKTNGPFWAPDKPNVLFIPVMRYVNKLSEHATAVSLCDQALSQNEAKLAKWLEHQTWSYGEKYLAGVPSDKQSWIRGQLRTQTQQTVSRYQLVVLNQLAVLFCSVFDAFQSDLLTSILRKEPKVLLEVGVKTEIPLSIVLAEPDYGALLDKLTQQAVQRFDHFNVHDRIDKLRKIGLRFSIQDQQNQAMRDLYSRRNRIVHQGALPFESFDPLSAVQTVLIQIMHELTFAASKKFFIPDDFVGPFAAWMNDRPEMQEFLQRSADS